MKVAEVLSDFYQQLHPLPQLMRLGRGQLRRQQTTPTAGFVDSPAGLRDVTQPDHPRTFHIAWHLEHNAVLSIHLREDPWNAVDSLR